MFLGNAIAHFSLFICNSISYGGNEFTVQPRILVQPENLTHKPHWALCGSSLCFPTRTWLGLGFQWLSHQTCFPASARLCKGVTKGKQS